MHKFLKIKMIKRRLHIVILTLNNNKPISASQLSDSLALLVDESERIGHLAREDAPNRTYRGYK